ncbi:MAG: hypothetical protein CM15mP23_08460 [Cryomorphaceae bacterium]|nr:MAG: hypothetical protein CM15mP23_08460 [Cryomorphaceae bacterium]
MVVKKDEVLQLDQLKKQFTTLKNEIAKVIVGPRSSCRRTYNIYIL